MPNTQSKLNRLIDTKTNLRQKLISLGVDVPIDTPFKDYPSLIEQLGGVEITETTTDQDLLQMVDLYHYLGSAQYEDYTYSDEEIADVHNLLDTIIDGEEIVEPELEPTVLLITDIGETRYHEGETFSLDGYTITAVYGDGRRVDVTADCSFTPSVELITEDEYVTISCEVDGIVLTVKQAIDVTVAPTFVDYIQSSNTQYINTEFLPNQDTTVEMKIFRTTPRAYWFGTWNTAYNNGAYALCNDSTSVYSGYDGQGGGTGSPVSDGEHVIKLDKNVVYIDGEVFREFEYTDFQVNYSLYLFAQNRAGTTYFSSTSGENAFVMTECKIYDNGVLVRDFKPCQDGEEVYCLYDTVRKKYHYNQGTGVFKGGNFEEATQLDYIESSGTQYIDTGIIAVQDNDYEIESEWVMNTNTENVGLYGSQGTNRGLLCFQYFGTSQLHFTSGSIVASSSECHFQYNPNVKYSINHKVDTANSLIEVTVNDEELTSLTYTDTVDTTLSMYIFKNNYPSGSQNGIKARLLSFKVHENGVLIRDFVPYKDELGVICLKDLVENKYYYNKGTGAFTGNMFLEPEQLDYIESTGTQYIDTGYCANGHTKYELEIKNSTTNGVLFGGYNTTWTDGSGMYTNVATTNAYDYIHYASNTNTGHISETNNIIVIDKGNVTINDTVYLETETKEFETTVPMFIFAGNKAGVVEQPTSYALRYFKIYDDDVLVRDFVPYKDEFGVICLKDLVENKYYYNKGTGKFLGPIPNNVTVLNYIESTGTQYINTGISAPNGYRAVLKTNITGFTTGYSVLVGSHESSSPYKDNYLRYLNTGVPELGMYNSLKVTNITLRSGIDYTIDSNNVYNKHYLKINGVSATFSGSVSSSTKSDKTLGLMGLHTGNNVGSQFTKVKLYYCRIYNNVNVLLRDFIPCKDNYEVVCMYDRVSDQYFYNQGTGEFLGE